MLQWRITKFSVQRTVVVQDFLIGFTSYANKNNTAQETKKNLQKFVQPDQTPGVIHTGNSLEIIRAGEDFCWNHDNSTPCRSETNGNAPKHAVRRVKACTSALLCQSGTLEKCLGEAMECFFYLQKIQDNLADNKHTL